MHQREPKPCKIEKVTDVFTRRPSGDFENSANSKKTEAATSTGAAAPTKAAAPAKAAAPTEATETAAKSTNDD